MFCEAKLGNKCISICFADIKGAAKNMARSFLLKEGFTLKTARELKKYVFSRVMCCCGELCTIFFLTIGGISMFVLACIFAAENLSASGGESPFPYGKLILICTAVFILLMTAATPLYYGVCWYRIQQVQGNSVHARSIFSCYTSIGKLWSVFRLNSILIIKKLYVLIPAAGISALCFYIAGIIENGASKGAEYYAALILASAITAGMLCAVLIFNSQYSAVPYLYVLEHGRSASERIGISRKLMQGKKRYLSEVMLSLTGWLVPCLIIFPMIFIVPYMQMVYTAAINEIILSRKSEHGEEGNSDGSKGSGSQLFMPEGTS